jgi:hypothetical protein
VITARPAVKTPTLPAWATRLFEQHAPSLPENRQQWFARDLHRFLGYAKNRAVDKLDLPLMGTEYVGVLQRGKMNLSLAFGAILSAQNRSQLTPPRLPVNTT